MSRVTRFTTIPFNLFTTEIFLFFYEKINYLDWKSIWEYLCCRWKNKSCRSGIPLNILGLTWKYVYSLYSPRCIIARENRIYIRGEFTGKKSVKRPFWCTVSILQVYFTYLCYITFWALEYHFIENLKLMLKEHQIMK